MEKSGPSSLRRNTIFVIYRHILFRSFVFFYPVLYFIHLSIWYSYNIAISFPGGSDSKESACNEGNLSLSPMLERSPLGGHDNPFQYSCLENTHGQRSLGGLQSMGSRRVGHNQVTKHSTAREWGVCHYKRRAQGSFGERWNCSVSLSCDGYMISTMDWNSK